MSTEKEEQIQEEFFETHEIIVDPKQTPLRIDKFLLERLARVTRTKIQNAIRSGSITVNGEMVKPNFKVKFGHTVNVVLPRQFEVDTKIVPQDIPLDIRYEDDDILIVHKPPGLVVHPGVGNRDGTLVNALAWHFKDLPVMEGNSEDRIGLVHRIDKDTSGLLVIAKTSYAMTHLAKQFFDHSIERTYQALVWGDIEESDGTITGNIARHERDRRKYTVYPDDEEIGKHAITHYRLLENYYYCSLIECRLETGRTHQIRVHMKHIGHPVFNDSTYGGNRVVKGTVFTKYKAFVDNTFKILPRQALHAKSLGFVHPTTGEKVFFEAELPADMQGALDRWRTYIAGRKSALKTDELE